MEKTYSDKYVCHPKEWKENFLIKCNFIKGYSPNCTVRLMMLVDACCNVMFCRFVFSKECAPFVITFEFALKSVCLVLSCPKKAFNFP